VYHAGVIALLLPLALTGAVEVERVLALVNGAPVLASDLDLAEVAQLVPRGTGESDADYRHAEVEALIALELRWQDLEAAALTQRVQADLGAAWSSVVTRAGGDAALRDRLAGIGMPEDALRELVRRAAIVEAYVATRFGPFSRPTPREVEDAWNSELAPQLRAQGKPVPELSEVRGEVEALVRERKLDAEVARWTGELEQRATVVRYSR
jgi:hypothetical protein